MFKENQSKQAKISSQVSLSLTFYAQLLSTSITKAQKDRQLDCLFCAFGICVRVKAVLNWHLMRQSFNIEAQSLRSHLLVRLFCHRHFLKDNNFYIQRTLFYLKTIIVWPGQPKKAQVLELYVKFQWPFLFLLKFIIHFNSPADTIQ